MKSKLKQFGPLWVWDDVESAAEGRVGVGFAQFSRVPEYYPPHPHDVVEWDEAYGPIDEMIKALREAANWLEWRRGCEG